MHFEPDPTTQAGRTGAPHPARAASSAKHWYCRVDPPSADEARRGGAGRFLYGPLNAHGARDARSH